MPWEKQFDKAEVLDRALQTFWAHGYEATSMQTLVDCTGVNRASLYATYGDKRALFLEALRAYDDGRRKMLAEFERRYRPLEAIRKVFLAFLADVSSETSSRGCFMTNTALELAAHDAEIRRVVARAQEEVEAFFTAIIKKGKADGSVAAHVKPAETARGLLASLLGFLVLVRSRPNPTFLNAIVDDAIRRLS
jgi:TetR/AcrR family transcriptional repressor of nem operon